MLDIGQNVLEIGQNVLDMVKMFDIGQNVGKNFGYRMFLEKSPINLFLGGGIGEFVLKAAKQYL